MWQAGSLCLSGALNEQALIATAHTLDDQLETFLMHFARGAGLHGLCGIPAKRGRIIRPLIGCTREEIEAYCAKRQIPYVIDSTNLSHDYVRNRVRLEIVPVLRGINPNVQELRAAAWILYPPTMCFWSGLPHSRFKS